MVTNTRQYLINWADKAEAIEKRATGTPWNADGPYLIANVPNGRPSGENIAMFVEYPRHEKVPATENCELTAIARNSFRPFIKLIRWVTNHGCNGCDFAQGKYLHLGEWYRGDCPYCTPFLASLRVELPEIAE